MPPTPPEQRIGLCPFCRAPVTTVDEVMAGLLPGDRMAADALRRFGEAMGLHVLDAHPDRVSSWLAVAAEVGLLDDDPERE